MATKFRRKPLEAGLHRLSYRVNPLGLTSLLEVTNRGDLSDDFRIPSGSSFVPLQTTADDLFVHTRIIFALDSSGEVEIFSCFLFFNALSARRILPHNFFCLHAGVNFPSTHRSLSFFSLLTAKKRCESDEGENTFCYVCVYATERNGK
jgi:hypothetical protein